MKIIGIVSRVHGINYGANLQAYALQQTWLRLGGRSVYINYRVDPSINGLKHKLLSFLYRTIRIFLGYYVRARKTKMFQKRYLVYSKKIRHYQDLKELSGQYDILLAGSDQIWNPRYYNAAHGLYLLSFATAETPKYSYASSFGVSELPHNLVQDYHLALSDFKSITVREKTGVRLLKDMGLTATCALDPTFLLNAEDWRKIIKSKVIGDQYILCYIMPGDDQLNQFVLEKAQEYNRLNNNKYRIYVLGDKEYKGLFSPSRFKYIRTAAPDDFINIIDHAAYVMTSSFHGTCFSIILRKNFNSILHRKNVANSRIQDLLQDLSLQDRIIYYGSHTTLYEPIDYKPLLHILQSKIYDSINYLKFIIS